MPDTYALIDIDGVVADVRHRLHHLDSRPKDWDGFFSAAASDPVLSAGRALVQELSQRCEIVYVTGRPERCRRDTERWLLDNELPSGHVLMRSDRDRRPARFTKVDRARALSDEKPVEVIVDDDPAVVAALRDAGFHVVLADWMPARDDEQASLFDAQESEGRT